LVSTTQAASPKLDTRITASKNIWPRQFVVLN
jgi:hypothetical protein